MINFLRKFFDSNEKEIEKLKPIILQINSLEEKSQKLKDSEFPKKTNELRERVLKGESLDFLLPEAFALVREASRRTINQRHFNVQLIAAMVLAHGKIAEQKTGEGKTLSAVPALYLHSLTGKNIHLVTVNDYLARRDAGWMGPIFHLLGVSVSSIINEQSFLFDPKYKDINAKDDRLAHLKPILRKQAYEADIVYGINSEFGFDYLRDNMAPNIESVVQKGYYFAIVDEVDSVLIDEARTPHIISAPQDEPSEKYYEYAKLVDRLTSNIDYKIDEKLRTAHLTDHGIGKIEKLFGVPNIYEKDFDTVYHLEAALKARTLFHREKDYIVKDSQVILVDEFTGRLMIGRRLSEGLHQALEAKEMVPIQRESRTLATVSLQNYFRMYEKLAGMTGTAVTEAEEFSKIYKLDVVAIPTNKPMKRLDLSDAVYKTGRAKYSAVATAIEEAHRKGQPVLVGTTSIEKNEIVSDLLKRRGIKHEILNAKNHEREAEIIAQAGVKGAVTVATNMAGRGVDIILGGSFEKNLREWQKCHDEVISLGGLFIIGTERHESRRIDNQLRGRAGRQGDPGKSSFYVALDDEIMRLFGGETISNLMSRFNMPEDVPLQHGLVSRAIEQAQIKVEGFNFDIRKHLVEYDDVLNKQREIIYSLRRKVLEQKVSKSLEVSKVSNGEKFSLKSQILEKIQNTIASIVTIHSSELIENTNKQIIEEFVTIIPFDEGSKIQLKKQLGQLHDIEQKTEFLSRIAFDIYEKREEDMGSDLTRELEQFVMLSTIDNLWTEHLDAIENLRSGIGLRGYGQRDPLIEYKNEAYTMFERLISAIDDEIVHRIYKIHVQQAPHVEVPKEIIAKPAGSDKVPEVSISSKPQSASSQKKIGRNDPCWCGSGNKFKKCHGR